MIGATLLPSLDVVFHALARASVEGGLFVLATWVITRAMSWLVRKVPYCPAGNRLVPFASVSSIRVELPSLMLAIIAKARSNSKARSTCLPATHGITSASGLQTSPMVTASGLTCL